MNVSEIAEMCVVPCAWGDCPLYDHGVVCPDNCNDMHYIAFCMVLDDVPFK